jgi:hypothetical protein
VSLKKGISIEFATMGILLVSLLLEALSSPACPDVQGPAIRAEYEITKHTGRFYEIMFKDPVEDMCACFVKDREVTDVGLTDADQLFCGMHDAKHFMWVNGTEQNLFNGSSCDGGKGGACGNANFDLVFETPLIKRIHYPNQVLGFGRDATGAYGGKYVWTVEYQCMEVLGVRDYLGVNIYHRHWDPPAADLAAIQAVIDAAGLSALWNSTKLKPISSSPMCNFTANPR